MPSEPQSPLGQHYGAGRRWFDLFAQASPKKAWAVVIDSIRQDLKRFLMSNLSLSAVEAEDIIHDVYLELIDRPAGSFEYRNDSSTRRYVYTGARLKGLGYLRKNTRARPGGSHPGAHLDIDLTMPVPDIVALRDLAARLPERRKLIVFLKYFQDLRTSEIATLLDKSDRWVRHEMSESLRQIRSWLDEEPQENEQ